MDVYLDGTRVSHRNRFSVLPAILLLFFASKKRSPFLNAAPAPDRDSETEPDVSGLLSSDEPISVDDFVDTVENGTDSEEFVELIVDV